MYNRFFAFGCSFTYYKWPTWADYLYAGNISEEYQNWGLPGGSNSFIFHSLTECDATNTINKDDLVCIMWSQPHRLADYTHTGGWKMSGSVFTFQPKERVQKYWDEDHSTMQTLSYIHAAKRILDGIGCDYKFLSLSKINLRPDYTHKFKNVQRSISVNMDEFLGYTPEEIRNNGWRDTLPGDYHPSPLEHSKLAKSLEYNTNKERIDKLSKAASDYIFSGPNPEKQIITVFPEKHPTGRLPAISGKINGSSGELVNVSTLQPFNWE